MGKCSGVALIALAIVLTGCGDLTESEALSKADEFLTSTKATVPVKGNPDVSDLENCKVNHTASLFSFGVGHFPLPDKASPGLHYENVRLVGVSLTDTGQRFFDSVVFDDLTSRAIVEHPDEYKITAKFDVTANVKASGFQTKSVRGIRHVTESTERLVEFDVIYNPLRIKVEDHGSVDEKDRQVSDALDRYRMEAEFSPASCGLQIAEIKTLKMNFSKYSDGWRVTELLP